MKISLKNASLALCSILLAAMSLSSCNQLDDNNNYYEERVKTDDLIISKYLSDHQIATIKHSSGFYYQVLTANASGASLVKDDVVDFTYKISLLDGTVLEDSISAKNPLHFKLMSNTVVPEGLDNGIRLMKVGEVYRFFIPSYLAYGNYRSSNFPSNSNFIVDVKVLKRQSETDIEVAQLDSIDHFVKSNFQHFDKYASGLYYIENVLGTGAKPHNGDRVTINFTRKYLNGAVIKSVNDISIRIGNGEAVQGLEEGLKLMQAGGKAVLVMPASIAFGQSLCVLPQKTRSELLDDQLISSEVLPYSMVEYIVELKYVN